MITPLLPIDCTLAQLQQRFTDHLPIMRRAITFHLPRVAKRYRDEFETDVLAACWHAWVGLARRGQDPVVVGPAGIVTNAVRYVQNGRAMGTSKTGRSLDVYRASKRAGVQIMRINQRAGSVVNEGPWHEFLLSDGRVDPATQAAFRIDLPAWLATLSQRKREMALLLAEGYETGSAARELGVTPAAVSISRAALADSWAQFQGEESPSGTAMPHAHSERHRKPDARDIRSTRLRPDVPATAHAS